MVICSDFFQTNPPLFFIEQGHISLCGLLFIICSWCSNYPDKFVNFCHSAGFEASAVLPTIPRGLPASSGVCVHSSHAALSACLHHDLYCPPQVR